MLHASYRYGARWLPKYVSEACLLGARWDIKCMPAYEAKWSISLSFPTPLSGFFLCAICIYLSTFISLVLTIALSLLSLYLQCSSRDTSRHVDFFCKNRVYLYLKKSFTTGIIGQRLQCACLQKVWAISQLAGVSVIAGSPPYATSRYLLPLIKNWKKQVSRRKQVSHSNSIILKSLQQINHDVTTVILYMKDVWNNHITKWRIQVFLISQVCVEILARFCRKVPLRAGNRWVHQLWNWYNKSTTT